MESVQHVQQLPRPAGELWSQTSSEEFRGERMIDVAGKEVQDPAGTTVLSCASVVVMQWGISCCRMELLWSP
jgi:hypothetical protein